MGESKEPAVAKIGPELSDTQRMMYAFGDSRRPKAETAKVLETVVLSQITGVVTQVITHLSYYLFSTVFIINQPSHGVHELIFNLLWYLSTRTVPEICAISINIRNPFSTAYLNFAGCQGGHIQGLKDPESGGLALPHETQSCQGEKQQPHKVIWSEMRKALLSDFLLNLDELFSHFQRCKDW